MDMNLFRSGLENELAGNIDVAINIYLNDNSIISKVHLKYVKKFYQNTEHIDIPDIVGNEYDTLIKYYLDYQDKPGVYSMIGFIYYEFKSDYEKARKWCVLGHGHYVAQYYLGLIHENFKLNQKAFEYYKLSAEHGYRGAQYKIGNMYYYGKYINQDYIEARRWYKMAAKQNYRLAQVKMGNIYYYELGTQKNYKKAYKWYKMAAKQGSKIAQYNLGRMYYFGRGIDQNYSEAFILFKLAAEQGLKDAQFSVAHSYYHGEGTEQNFEQAFKWFMSAADQGCESSCSYLGAMYHKGYWVKQDYTAAFKYYSLAAEKGNPESKIDLAMLYKYGLGTDKNIEESMKWYKIAAKEGSAYAQCEVANVYYSGTIVKQNYEKAYKYYLLAATQNFMCAWNNLIDLHKTGKIFPNSDEFNKSESLKWSNKLNSNLTDPNLVDSIIIKFINDIVSYSWFTLKKISIIGLSLQFDTPPRVECTKLLSQRDGNYSRITHKILLNSAKYDMQKLEEEILNFLKLDDHTDFLIETVQLKKLIGVSSKASTLVHEFGHAILPKQEDPHGIFEFKIDTTKYSLPFDECCNFLWNLGLKNYTPGFKI